MTLDELIRAGRNFASVAETCTILDVEERSVYSAIDRGEIPATRVGTRWKVPVAWLRKVAALDAPAPGPAEPSVASEELATVVADKVVAQLARAFAVLAAASQDGP